MVSAAARTAADTTDTVRIDTGRRVDYLTWPGFSSLRFEEDEAGETVSFVANGTFAGDKFERTEEEWE